MLLSLVPREHGSRPTKGHRGGEGGHSQAQIQPAAEEGRGQQDSQGGVDCVHRWSCYSRA